jgi:hypothetical protein
MIGHGMSNAYRATFSDRDRAPLRGSSRQVIYFPLSVAPLGVAGIRRRKKIENVTCKSLTKQSAMLVATGKCFSRTVKLS